MCQKINFTVFRLSESRFHDVLSVFSGNTAELGYGTVNLVVACSKPANDYYLLYGITPMERKLYSIYVTFCSCKLSMIFFILKRC